MVTPAIHFGLQLLADWAPFLVLAGLGVLAFVMKRAARKFFDGVPDALRSELTYQQSAANYGFLDN